MSANTIHPSTQDGYVLCHSFKSGHNVVLCLGATKDGLYLSAGGTDGVTLFQQLAPIGHPAGVGERGATTAMIWIRCSNDPLETLLFGTQNGHLVQWKQAAMSSKIFKEKPSHQLKNAMEVTAIDYDSPTNRLAVADRNGMVALFNMEVTLVPILLVNLVGHLPKSLTFRPAPPSGGFRDILTFRLHNGMITLVEAEMVWYMSSKIGHATMSGSKDVFVIDDLAEGTALYRMNDRSRLQTFPVPTKRSRRPWQVAFDTKDHVQMVMASRFEGMSSVFAAGSTEMGEEASIFVWQKGVIQTPPSMSSSTVALSENGWLTKRVYIWLMGVATFMFVYQNILARCGVNFQDIVQFLVRQ
ncbi:hypothetical protein ARMGADRAFT_1037754 [Armillaria gallica]|uniref:WD40 repeat-like protein n=1 Tax=Armillaria gallica TaxID=47427 RepID=A0A2H3CWL7_ARMGA|nr:hypothetical protein ARMGADRAFT_1037754 [Armillaria gallica]